MTPRRGPVPLSLTRTVVAPILSREPVTWHDVYLDLRGVALLCGVIWSKRHPRAFGSEMRRLLSKALANVRGLRRRARLPRSPEQHRDRDERPLAAKAWSPWRRRSHHAGANVGTSDRQVLLVKARQSRGAVHHGSAFPRANTRVRNLGRARSARDALALHPAHRLGPAESRRAYGPF